MFAGFFTVVCGVLTTTTCAKKLAGQLIYDIKYYLPIRFLKAMHVLKDTNEVSFVVLLHEK